MNIRIGSPVQVVAWDDEDTNANGGEPVRVGEWGIVLPQHLFGIEIPSLVDHRGLLLIRKLFVRGPQHLFFAGKYVVKARDYLPDNMTGADLRCADLRGVNIRGAVFVDVFVDGVIWDEKHRPDLKFAIK